MNIFGNLVRSLRSGSAGQQAWSIAEVRELIDRRDLEAAESALEKLAEGVQHRAAEQASLRGEIAFHRSCDDDAAAAFREALEDVPGLASAHYGMSLLLAAKGEFEDGARHAQFALAANPKEPRYLAQVGYCHVCIGNFQAAENPLRRATLSTSKNRFLWNNLGIVLRAKGEAAEARECFERALALDPSFEAARQHLQQIDAEIAAGSVERSHSTDNAHALRADSANSETPELVPVLELESTGELQRAIDVGESLLLAQPDNGRVPVLLSLRAGG